MYKIHYKSVIGVLEITGTEDGIVSLEYAGENQGQSKDVSGCLKECVRQLDEYFAGTRKEFSLKLIPEGTAFQKKVWDALSNILYGKNATYGEIARAVGSERAARAVGNANNKNRIAIIIPCHRVIGSSGKLIGYAGGLWRKEWLLEHEKRYL